jgi:phage terminase large subunit-like protein
MRAGTKGRKNAQIVIITNSGFDKTSICWQLHEYSRKVLEGVIENDAWFAFVCQLDPCDEHAKAGRQFPDEKCLKCDRWDVEGPHWRKANPNLGVSITWDYLRELVREAKGMPASAAIVQRLNFCVWTEQRVVFLDMGAWLECATFTEDELGGATCYAGLDLGQSDDLSAFVRIWTLADGRIAVKARFWVPESALQQYPERPYAQWKAAGVLEITQGTTTDEDQVEEAVQADCLADGVRTLAYDKRFANHMALHLQGAGITCVDTPQGFQLTEAMRRLEKLTKDRAIAHNGNPILAWMASNLVARFGRNKEVRPDKDASAEKIDGVVALIMALDAALDELPESASVYDSPEREDGIALIDFS